MGKNIKKAISEDFHERKAKYEELKDLRQILKSKKEEQTTQLIRERKRIEKKRSKKQENQLKSENYQVIKNPEKIKKWKTKARKLIRNVPKEIFYDKYFK